MNGTNNFPAWFRVALQVGGLLVAGVIAFSTLSANVKTNKASSFINKMDIAEIDIRVNHLEEVQIEAVTTLRYIKESVDEIKQDLKAHRNAE